MDSKNRKGEMPLISFESRASRAYAQLARVKSNLRERESDIAKLKEEIESLKSQNERLKALEDENQSLKAQLLQGHVKRHVAGLKLQRPDEKVVPEESVVADKRVEPPVELETTGPNWATMVAIGDSLLEQPQVAPVAQPVDVFVLKQRHDEEVQEARDAFQAYCPDANLSKLAMSSAGLCGRADAAKIGRDASIIQVHESYIGALERLVLSSVVVTDVTDVTGGANVTDVTDVTDAADAAKEV